MSKLDPQRALAEQLVGLLEGRRRELARAAERPSVARHSAALTQRMRNASALTDVGRQVRVAGGLDDVGRQVRVAGGLNDVARQVRVAGGLNDVARQVRVASGLNDVGTRLRYTSGLNDIAKPLDLAGLLKPRPFPAQMARTSPLIDVSRVVSALLPALPAAGGETGRWANAQAFKSPVLATVVRDALALTRLTAGPPSALTSSWRIPVIPPGMSKLLAKAVPPGQFRLPPDFFTGLIPEFPKPSMFTSSIFGHEDTFQLPSAFAEKQLPALATLVAELAVELPSVTGTDFEDDANADIGAEPGLGSWTSRRERAFTAAYELSLSLLKQATQRDRAGGSWLWPESWWTPSLVRLWPSLSSVERKKVRDQMGLIVGSLIALAAALATGTDFTSLAVVSTLVCFSFTVSQLYTLIDELDEKHR